MADFYNRDQMWFGTEEYMGWIETPQTGADVSSEGFFAGGTNMHGGGYVRNSWDSHKIHQFAWGDSADLDLASLLLSYRDGSYGRGLIYFHDPMYYQVNILPGRWADPSMALNYEAAPLIRDLFPRSTPTAANSNRLPIQTTIYDIPNAYSAQTAGDELFIPIPEGFTLNLGAVYSTTNSNAHLYYRTPAGISIMATTLPGATDLVPHTISGQPWVRLGLRNISGATRAVSITAIMARLLPPGESPEPKTPWKKGHGHSGCRFQGVPTLVNYNGVNGGQVGLACTLVETGAWE